MYVMVRPLTCKKLFAFYIYGLFKQITHVFGQKTSVRSYSFSNIANRMSLLKSLPMFSKPLVSYNNILKAD